MGVDIHMSLINKNGEELIHRLYDGRNSEWFSNLQDRGWDSEYDHLPSHYGLPDNVPEKIREDASHEPGYGYYGFHYMNYTEYKEWFNKYKPDLQAGWVSTYDKWRIEKKGYIPEELPHYLDADDRIEDMHFVEFVNEWNPDKNVLIQVEGYLHKHRDIAEEDLIIVYYFDC